MSAEKKLGGRRSLDERKMAVAKFLNGIKADDVAEQHGVSAATIYQWVRDFKEGKIFDPEVANGKIVRKQYTEEFREKVLAAYYQRGSRSVGEVAADFGVTAHHVHQWANRAKQNGGAIVKHEPAKQPVQQPVQASAPSQRLAVLVEATKSPGPGRDKKKIQALALAVRVLADALLEEG